MVTLNLSAGAMFSLGLCVGIILGIAGLIGGGLWFKRWLHSGILLETRPDYRLASRYGAGVSRHVRYLEGQEAAKTKTIF